MGSAVFYVPVFILNMRILGLLLFLSLITSCKKELADLPYEKMQVPVSVALRDVHVFNANEFVISGGDDGTGVIMYTADGGTNWEISNTVFDNQVNSISFLNRDTGYCADSDILIYKTTNGGHDWNAFFGTSWPLTVNRNLRDIWFTSDSTGFVCGGKNYGNGVLFQTGNAGNYWSYREYSHEYRGICFENALNGVMCGYGSLLSTTDGGYSFKAIENRSAYYTGITHCNGTYWLCDFNGGVYTFTGTGQNWTEVRNAKSWNVNHHQQTCLAISPGGAIAIAGPNGFFTWSSDNGSSWNDRTSFGGSDILQMAWIDNMHLIAVGKNGVFKVSVP